MLGSNKKLLPAAVMHEVFTQNVLCHDVAGKEQQFDSVGCYFSFEDPFRSQLTLP